MNEAVKYCITESTMATELTDDRNLNYVISTWTEFSRLLLEMPPGLSRVTAVSV